jgi:hypothetical protein
MELQVPDRMPPVLRVDSRTAVPEWTLVRCARCGVRFVVDPRRVGEASVQLLAWGHGLAHV